MCTMSGTRVATRYVLQRPAPIIIVYHVRRCETQQERRVTLISPPQKNKKNPLALLLFYYIIITIYIILTTQSPPSSYYHFIIIQNNTLILPPTTYSPVGRDTWLQFAQSTKSIEQKSAAVTHASIGSRPITIWQRSKKKVGKTGKWT